MKTLVACLLFAAIGITLGFTVNQRRYGNYEAAFGPMSYRGEIDASNAMASLQKNWSDKLPKVELPDGNEHDFGVMAPEEDGEHIFVIKNVGEEKLTLKIGASTCKCTVGELGNESLEPGEQTEVKMSWTVNTSDKSFGQSAELRTNDPSKVAIRFEIKGQVVRELQLVPEEITFGEIAAGDDIEIEVKVFSYLDYSVRAGEPTFSDEALNELAEFKVTTFEPTAEDGIHEAAKQAFRVQATIKPGLKQGPINQNLMLPLLPEGDEQQESTDQETTQTDPAANAEENAAEDAQERTVFVAVTGRIVGALSLMPNKKYLTGVAGGGYIYNFGMLDENDSMTAKTFVMLKGEERAGTQLSIGEIEPAEYVEATLGEPVGKGSMALYTLELKLKPGAENVDRLGMGKSDYGFVTIESDNPKVPALKLLLKFAIPAR